MKQYTAEFFREAGKRGGIATAKKYSKKQRQKWGRIRNKKSQKPKEAGDNLSKS